MRREPVIFEDGKGAVVELDELFALKRLKLLDLRLRSLHLDEPLLLLCFLDLTDHFGGILANGEETSHSLVDDLLTVARGLSSLDPFGHLDRLVRDGLQAVEDSLSNVKALLLRFVRRLIDHVLDILSSVVNFVQDMMERALLIRLDESFCDNFLVRLREMLRLSVQLFLHRDNFRNGMSKVVHRTHDWVHFLFISKLLRLLVKFFAECTRDDRAYTGSNARNYRANAISNFTSVNKLLRLCVDNGYDRFDRCVELLLGERTIDDLLNMRGHVSDSREHTIGDLRTVIVQTALSGSQCAAEGSGSSAKRAFKDFADVDIELLGLGLRRLLGFQLAELSLNVLKELLLLKLVLHLIQIKLLHWLSDSGDVGSDILRSCEVRDRGSSVHGSGLMLREGFHSGADSLACHVRVAIKDQELGLAMVVRDRHNHSVFSQLNSKRVVVKVLQAKFLSVAEKVLRKLLELVVMSLQGIEKAELL